jgi:hypothetical protein
MYTSIQEGTRPGPYEILSAWGLVAWARCIAPAILYAVEEMPAAVHPTGVRTYDIDVFIVGLLAQISMRPRRSEEDSLMVGLPLHRGECPVALVAVGIGEAPRAGQ